MPSELNDALDYLYELIYKINAKYESGPENEDLGIIVHVLQLRFNGLSRSVTQGKIDFCLELLSDMLGVIARNEMPALNQFKHNIQNTYNSIKKLFNLIRPVTPAVAVAVAGGRRRRRTHKFLRSRRH